MNVQDLPAELKTAPPAPRIIYYALLNADSPVTTQELATATGYHRSTVRRALRDLVDRGYVETVIEITDIKTSYYKLSPPERD